VLVPFYFRTQDWSSASSSTTYYSSYDTATGSTNWWEYANMVNSYGMMSVAGLTFITQILSMAGIA